MLLGVGLLLYGLSLTLLVRADLGLAPWDVFHQGLADAIGWSLGATIVLTSIVVLALWIPLRERPGVGTVANAVVVGLAVELFTAIVPEVDLPAVRWLLLGAGVVGNGIATGMYIGAGMGPGPRDGLMTGIARRRGSIRVVRTAIEVTVLVVGIVLGGTFGIGTVLYAMAIGPLVHRFLPWFTALGAAEPRERAAAANG